MNDHPDRTIHGFCRIIAGVNHPGKSIHVRTRHTVGSQHSIVGFIADLIAVSIRFCMFCLATKGRYQQGKTKKHSSLAITIQSAVG
jgi:hypothetical protein